MILETCTNNILAIGAERNTQSRPKVAFEFCEFLAVLKVPDPDRIGEGSYSCAHKAAAV
jgi:hypothetical protein